MNSLIKQIIRFGFVGLIAFLIDYGVFAILTFIHVHYLIAQLIAFIIALAFNYICSIKWIFNAKKQTIKEFVIFILLSIGGLIITELLLYIGIDIMNKTELIVKLFATLIAMIYNFITRKIFIEKRYLD